MNKRILKSILIKDMKSLLVSPKTWIPMILIPILLCIVLPFGLSYSGHYTNAFDVREYPELERIINALILALPAGSLKEHLIALEDMGMKFVYFVVNFILISIFLMVTIINSMVTSINSFVGEKERGTLETLLFSPVSVKELFFAKILSSFLPAVLITYITYILSFLVLNSMNYPKFGYLLLFNDMWLVLLFWVVPTIVLFNVLLNVFVSAKVKTFQEAQQFGGLFVLPMIGLITAQSTGIFMISTSLLIIAGFLFVIINSFLFYLLLKSNKRNNLFENQIH